MPISDQAFTDYVERSADDVIYMRQQYEAQITRLRRVLCEYQLKYWTIQYKLSLFSIEGDA